MGISSKDRRRITEGSPRGDFGVAKAPGTGQPIRADASVRERDEAVGMADIECPDKERRGGMGLEVAGKPRHTLEGTGAGGERKKEKAPQEKSPQQKKRNRCLRLRLLTGGCAALLSRFFSLFPSPRFSLLLWAAAPPLLFASPLALLSGGCAALPLPLLLRFSSAFSAAAPPLSSSRSRGRLAPPPLATLSFLSIKQLTILSVAVTSHKLFFFCHNNIFLD